MKRQQIMKEAYSRSADRITWIINTDKQIEQINFLTSTAHVYTHQHSSHSHTATSARNMQCAHYTIDVYVATYSMANVFTRASCGYGPK
mgnify:CR=1 FL=1